MKRNVLTIAAMAAVLALGTMASCHKDTQSAPAPVQQESLAKVNLDDIIWGQWDERSQIRSHEKLRDLLMDSHVVLVAHPDSVGIGQVPCSTLSAKALLRLLKECTNPASKVFVIATQSEEEYNYWYATMREADMVVISYRDKDGFYYGRAYTKDEWEELTGQKID